MPEIIPMLCLSTGHIPEAVRRDLDAITGPGADFPCDDWRSRILATPWFDYGWILHVAEDEGDDCPFPPALADCLAFARCRAIHFLKLDCDVEPIPDLPFFEDQPVDPQP